MPLMFKSCCMSSCGRVTAAPERAGLVGQLAASQGDAARAAHVEGRRRVAEEAPHHLGHLDRRAIENPAAYWC
jgi:hypothetical protein